MFQEHYRGATAGKSEIYQHKDKLNISIKICKSVEDAKVLEANLIRKYNTVKNGWNDDRYDDYIYNQKIL